MSYLFGWTGLTWGYLSAAVASFTLGSYNLPIKVRAIQKLNPDAMVLQSFMNLAIFALGWIFLVPLDPESKSKPLSASFNLHAIVSSGLWVTSNVLVIFSVNNIGGCATQGISYGITIIVSYLWGLAFGEVFGYLSVLGIICVAAGIAGMAVSGSDILYKFFDEEKLERPPNSKDKMLSDKLTSQNLYTSRSSDMHLGHSNSNILIGVSSSCLLGFTYGTMFVPMLMSQTELSTNGVFIFLFSFSLGVAIVTPFFVVTYFIILRLYFSGKDLSIVRLFPLVGGVSGILWSIGNCCSAFATMFLGLSCGFPLVCTSVFISGIWGILLFDEIKGAKSIGLFLFSACILLGGAFIVGFAHQQQQHNNNPLPSNNTNN